MGSSRWRLARHEAAQPQLHAHPSLEGARLLLATRVSSASFGFRLEDLFVRTEQVYLTRGTSSLRELLQGAALGFPAAAAVSGES